MTTFRKELIA